MKKRELFKTFSYKHFSFRGEGQIEGKKKLKIIELLQWLSLQNAKINVFR